MACVRHLRCPAQLKHFETGSAMQQLFGKQHSATDQELESYSYSLKSNLSSGKSA